MSASRPVQSSAPSPRYATCTVWRTVGSAASIASTSARLSTDLLAVAVPVDREQHDRLDLCEAVDHRTHAELRRARRPHRAEAGGGQERDRRLRDVGQVRGDAIAALHPQPHEPGPAPRHRVGERGPRELLGAARLAGGDDRDVVGPRRRGGERVLRVVQGGAREPGRPGHRPFTERGCGPIVPAHARPFGDRVPERVELVDRPPPKIVVSLEAQITGARQPVEERADAGRRPGVGRPASRGSPPAPTRSPRIARCHDHGPRL